MKLTGRHLLIALVALAMGAVPALALAQSPFGESRDAASDQYGTTTTTTPSTTTTTPAGVTVTVAVTTPVGTVDAGVTASGQATGSPSTTPTKTTKGNGNGGTGNANGNGKKPDKGGNAPDSESGANTGAANANGGALGAGGAGNGSAASACDWQPYAWISFGPARQDAFAAAQSVTGTPMYLAQFTEPIDPAVLEQVTAGTRWAGAESDNGKLVAFARALGRSVVGGGVLAQTALPKLATTVTSDQIHPPAGFVLTEDEPTLSGTPDEQRDAFTKAFLAGMRSVKIPTATRGQRVHVPIVGVETRALDDTTVPFFKGHKVSSVDNVDKAGGQRSLSRALSGYAGHFGVKEPSNGLLRHEAAPLLCRPTADYEPGDLIRRSSETGLPGGGRSLGVLMLLGLVTTGGLLAIAERRTRSIRRRGAK